MMRQYIRIEYSTASWISEYESRYKEVNSSLQILSYPQNNLRGFFDVVNVVGNIE